MGSGTLELELQDGSAPFSTAVEDLQVAGSFIIAVTGGGEVVEFVPANQIKKARYFRATEEETVEEDDVQDHEDGPSSNGSNLMGPPRMHPQG